MIEKYRKKPVIVEAIVWDGYNITEIVQFVKQSHTIKNGVLVIHTLEGDHVANKGDYIIKGIAGEFYPCKPDIFNDTYEFVD